MNIYKRIILQTVISILIFFSIQNKGFSQKSLDYYFNDGGLSKANNLISIDVIKLIDLSASLKYKRYLGKMIAFDVGASYRFGHTIPNDFALLTSMFSGLFGGTPHLYSFTELIPVTQGYEFWGGFSLANNNSNKRFSMTVNYGYLNYSKNLEFLKSQFAGFIFSWKLYQKKHFLLLIDLNERTLIDLQTDSGDYMGDILIGIGLSTAYKF